MPNPNQRLSFIGVGFAFSAPTWTSIVPQVVSDTELLSAPTLSGLQLNLSGILGPALGGFLVSSAGSNFVFIANAVCFLLVILSMLMTNFARRVPAAERPNDAV
jgi:MFS family permease